jgi:hypothetical protein
MEDIRHGLDSVESFQKVHEFLLGLEPDYYLVVVLVSVGIVK